MNILISSAGRRVSLVKFFKDELIKLSPKSKLFTSDLNPEMSSACRISDKSFKVKKITQKGAVEELIKVCTSNNISLIIPTIDTELLILSRNKLKFNSFGIKILISENDVINFCRDKRKTHHFFDKLSIPRCEEFLHDELKFPLFIKPIDGSMSRGLKKIENERSEERRCRERV